MRLLRLITYNFQWKLLALAIAVVIWALVASEPELSTFATVRLEFKNLPDDLDIGSETAHTISLELRGPSGELRNETGQPYGLGAVPPAVVLDMSGVGPGERTFAIGNSSVRLARGVRLVRAIPSEVRFQIERRRERMVPVSPRFRGEGSNGYAVDQVTVNPKEVQIEGPASHVARITEVMTDAMDVSSVVGSSEFHVNAYVDDPFVRFSGSPQVTVSVVMKKKS
jgi:YbbR domain-containing protein